MSSRVSQTGKAPFDVSDFLIEFREEASHIGVRDAAIRDEPFHDPLRLRRGYSDCGSLFHGHSFTRGEWYIGVLVVPAVLQGSDGDSSAEARPAWARTATDWHSPMPSSLVDFDRHGARVRAACA